MKDNRPVNLAINTIKFPLAAIASIIHRITGAFLFIGIALLLYLLQLSLASEAGFAEAVELLSNPLGKVLLWAVLAGLAYHFVAGIKHLILDMGIGESKKGARVSAVLVLLSAAVLIILAGAWIW